MKNLLSILIAICALGVVVYAGCCRIFAQRKPATAEKEIIGLP